MKISKLALFFTVSLISGSSIQAFAADSDTKSTESNAPVSQSVQVEDKGVYDGLRHAISGQVSSHIVFENAETGVTVYAIPDATPVQINK